MEQADDGKEPAEEYGSLMAALSEQQRTFIKAMLSNPWGNGTDWAKAAGYSDTGASGKTAAYRLTHNTKIMAAAREYAAGHFLDGTGVTMAISVLISELTNNDGKVRLAAANSILDRGGVSAKTEHRVVVTHSVEDMEKIAHRLAAELGVEPMKLIGGNTVSHETIDLQKPQHEIRAEKLRAVGLDPQLGGTRVNQRIFEGKRAAAGARPDEPTSGELARGTDSPPGPIASTQVPDVLEVGISSGPVLCKHGVDTLRFDCPSCALRAFQESQQVRQPGDSISESAAELVRQQMDIDSDLAF